MIKLLFFTINNNFEMKESKIFSNSKIQYFEYQYITYQLIIHSFYL